MTARARRSTARIVAALVLAALGLALAAALALGGPGDLDRGFGDDGSRRIEGLLAAEALVLQPDGKILVAGWNGDVAVTRLNPDGSDDPAFGGPRLLDFGGFDMGTAVALQPDGKIVVAGRGGAGANAVVARLNPDGSPDLGFGAGGKRTIDLGGPTFDGAAGVAVQPDGKVLMAGVGGLDPTITVTRLMPDGADDAGFGPGGTRRIDFGLGYEEGRTLALQPDGKILVAGFRGVAGLSVIARLNPDGSPDLGFATAGKREIAGGSAEALAIQPDGGIVVAGAGGGGFLVTRLHQDGSDDLEFGAGGADVVSFGPFPARADAVALQQDGKIVAVGTAGSALAIARLHPAGTLDTTFGGFDQDGNRTGKRTVAFAVSAAATGVALQGDGRILAAGATNRAIVVRFEGDPRPAEGLGATVGAGARVAAGSLPRCAGRPATIVGTSGRDVLRGTRRADVIAALGGDDLVRVGGGGDLVCGGAGGDRLHGQRGADRLLGQAGADRLAGGAGRDVLSGGPARDRCLGGAGADRAACETRRGL